MTHNMVFRSGKSYETQLVYTLNDLAYHLEQGLVTGIIILDFAKAFDTVSHRKLLMKLKNYGIGTQLIRWLENFFDRQNSNCYGKRCIINPL